ncbi:uncharacterized protein N7506_003886 [Penicillium brevicompactum]|uniref:uncharacterized protein n=1 Tax=Penicillium brevicompactum TaxID=5074 RepID=UPI00254191A9|nr:uncharacterized protein N7506_003886 [Penicillium brevicompactum]KAJ5344062.1 hypothetical protein N7506_003886 [Penicillium brevicompactum]
MHEVVHGQGPTQVMDSERASATPNETTTFIPLSLTRKRILDDPKNEEAMRWSEDGRSIFIALESKFPVHLLTCHPRRATDLLFGDCITMGSTDSEAPTVMRLSFVVNPAPYNRLGR